MNNPPVRATRNEGEGGGRRGEVPRAQREAEEGYSRLEDAYRRAMIRSALSGKWPVNRAAINVAVKASRVN